MGKSFLSANFAFIQGGVGKRVLLIDADFRRHQPLFRRAQGRPVRGAVRHDPLEQVRRHSVSEGVDFISTGAVTFDPSELLASPVFGQTLRELSTQYDMVVLDTAPVLSSPDAAVVGSHAAAVMVVVRSGMNTVGEIRETAKRLIQAGAPVDGVLFNGLKLFGASACGPNMADTATPGRRTTAISSRTVPRRQPEETDMHGTLAGTLRTSLIRFSRPTTSVARCPRRSTRALPTAWAWRRA